MRFSPPPIKGLVASEPTATGLYSLLPPAAMKPSKRKSKRHNPSPAPPPPPAAGDESLSLNWLIDAFGSASLDQITSAYTEAGGDPYKAAGILGAELVDPGEGGGTRKERNRRPKRAPAAVSGIVPDVIEKEYLKPCLGRTRSCDADLEKKRCSAKEDEEFLCSMLGEDSELGLGVIRDVLGECGSNVEKALDALLDISASSDANFRKRGYADYMKGNQSYSGTCPETFSNNPRENITSSFKTYYKISSLTHHPSQENQFQKYEGYACRDSKERPPSRSETVKSDLQQMVLEALFNIRDKPIHEPKCMDWKKVVKKVESFGQELEFQWASTAQPLQNVKTGKGDDYSEGTIGKRDGYDGYPEFRGTAGKGDGYAEFRGTAKKHWDEMRNFYKKAAAAYSGGQRAHAAYLSEKGRYHGKLAHEADQKASREIFENRNRDIKNMVTIDLHGQHVKQAIGLLKMHLLLFTYIPSIQFLKVITGCGAVGVGKGKLKHTVIGLVQKEGIQWREENAGTLVLRVDGSREYSFTESDDSD